MKQAIKLISQQINNLSFTDTLNFFTLDCQSKNLSKKTIEWYQTRLNYFFEFLEEEHPVVTLNTITPQHLKLFIYHLQQRKHQVKKESNLSTYTIKGIVTVLKIFFKFLQQEDYLNFNPGEKIKNPRVKKKIIQPLTPEQINNLLSIPNKKTFTGFRNYCILLTFIDTGIRLSELIELKTNNLNFLNNTLIVLGKGNKERKIPFSMTLRKNLEKYLNWRKNISTETLFINQFGEKLKQRRIQRIITNYGKQAKINIRCSPHTFRHTFAMNTLMQGTDVLSLQYILGHSSLEMVRNYVNLTHKEIAVMNKGGLLDRLNITSVTKKIILK